MRNMEEQMQVYRFVREHASEYLSTIIEAITDEAQDRNEDLLERKVKVECGLIVLLDKIKIDKLSPSMEATLFDALKSCGAINVDYTIKKLQKQIKERG